MPLQVMVEALAPASGSAFLRRRCLPPGSWRTVAGRIEHAEIFGVYSGVSEELAAKQKYLKVGELIGCKNANAETGRLVASEGAVLPEQVQNLENSPMAGRFLLLLKRAPTRLQPTATSNFALQENSP